MLEANSFDIFDTLIARKCKNPWDIFKIIEIEYPYNGFFDLRCKSEKKAYDKYLIHTNIDNIYECFKSLTNENDDVIEKLKKFEINTEIEYSIPIVSNIKNIKDNDIYISDMYLKPDHIYKILEKHNININNKLFVTSGGKSTGVIYEKILEKYNINLHRGDNLHSDIFMANKNGINTFHTKIHEFTSTENLLYDFKLFEFQKSIRQFRLENPYQENSLNYKLYHEQITYNIPILTFFSFEIKKILDAENRNKVLFLTRDCCLLSKIFNKIFPKVKCINFASSRIIHYKPNIDYINYIKSNYNDEDTIIIDLNGSFWSGRKLYEKICGFYPRVHLLIYDNYKPRFNKLTFSINSIELSKKTFSSYIEAMNYDLNGTLFGFIDNVELRLYNENSIDDIEISHNTFLNFLEKNVNFLELENVSNKYRNFIKVIYNNIFNDNFDLNIHPPPMELPKNYR